MVNVKTIELRAKDTEVMMNSHVVNSYSTRRICRIADDELRLMFVVKYRVYTKYPDVIGMWKIVEESIPSETTVEEAHITAVITLRQIIEEMCGGVILELKTLGMAKTHEPIEVVYRHD